MKRILVLGSTGRVGRLLRLAWAQCPPSGVELILQSRDDAGVRWQKGDPIVFGPVDAVIALWGVTQGDANELDANVELALIAQQIGRECGAKQVLHCSSVAVYAPKDGPLSEDDPVGPLNAYGKAKLAMEQALASSAGGPEAICLRIGSVAGAESLANSIRRAWDTGGSPVTLDRFEDGKGPARSYIAPSDLAEVLIALATKEGVPSVVNIGSPRPVFMAELLQAANHPMHWREAPEGARQYAVLDCARLTDLVDLPDAASAPGHIIADWLQLEGRV